MVGKIIRPDGFLLHGSRSGVPQTSMQEFWATVHWAQSGANGLGWHATIGPGVVAVHMRPSQYGWNAGDPASYRYIAAEFCQPNYGDPIEDEQIEAYCWWVLNEVLPVWPDIPRVFVHHAQLEQGNRAGKTDVYPNDDARQAELIARIRRCLGW